MKFHGSHLTEADVPRLRSLYDLVEDVMSDGAWRTNAELVRELGKRRERGVDPASARRMRRKMREEGWEIEDKHLGEGLFEYRARRAVTGQKEFAFAAGPRS